MRAVAREQQPGVQRVGRIEQAMASEVHDVGVVQGSEESFRRSIPTGEEELRVTGKRVQQARRFLLGPRERRQRTERADENRIHEDGHR
jgi:hypothetical protein